MARTERHSVMYHCDQCPRREVVYDGEYRSKECGWEPAPAGWYTIARPRTGRVEVNLCSVKCLQEWAGKQGGSES